MNAILFVALFIIAVCLLGMMLTWSNSNKKKKERRKLNAGFDDFVIKNNLTIDKKQAVNKNMIGIDRLNLKLVFLDNSKGFQVFHLINLEDLSACHLIKQKNLSSGHISKIFLQCIFKNYSPEIALPFYDEMTDHLFKMLPLSNQAIYWQKCISIFREAAVLSAQNGG